MNQNIKNITYIFLIVGTLFLVFFISLKTHKENPPVEEVDSLLEFSIKDNPEEYKYCLESGGEWTKFSNSCADFCSLGESCLFNMVYSCDCGEGRCWSVDDLECAGVIDKKEETCTSKDDCLIFYSDCEDCKIKVVSKENIDKYKKEKIEYCTKNPPKIQCDFVFTGELECENNLCVIKE
ncbi:MAG: hypothetical protein PF572_05910 [Patescibacteria group bacterium]|nr:hypothetical protein [Patescibacteria group bacterium]